MAFPVSLVGVSKAGGVIKGPGQPRFVIYGAPVSLLGDAVEPHGPGLHLVPVMIEGSGMFKINGIPIVRTGNRASCDHTADGIPNFKVAI